MSDCCEVCGSESQGSHFGVLTCRACSAFFRRTAISTKWNSRKCQNERKYCRPGAGNYKCRPCRLKRCFDVGMKTENFQFNRDGLLVPSKVPKSFEMFVGRPEFVLFCTPSTSAEFSNSKTYIDVSYLIEKASIILKNGPELTLTARDQLQKLAIGFGFAENNSTDMKEFLHSTKEDVMKIWEFYFLTVAKWLTYFEEFQKLDHPLQMKLLITIWHVWGRLDKLLSTAINRRRGICGTKNLLTLSNGVYIDMEKQEVDVEWMSNYAPEQVLTFIDGVRAREVTDQIDALVELDLSNIESAFMLAQLSFQYAAKRFSGRIESICDHFQEILAENLHDYYKTEKKLERYSGRLTRMMKVNNIIQKNIWENRTKIKIAKTFDLFSLEISHPEMFYDTGF